MTTLKLQDDAAVDRHGKKGNRQFINRVDMTQFPKLNYRIQSYARTTYISPVH